MTDAMKRLEKVKDKAKEIGFRIIGGYMNSKNIKKSLNAKLKKSRLESIDDVEIQKVIKDNTIIMLLCFGHLTLPSLSCQGPHP